MLSNENRLPLLLGAAGALLVTQLIIVPLLNWQSSIAAENQRLIKQLAKAELRIADAPFMAERQAAIEAILRSSDAQLAKAEEKTKLTQQKKIEQLLMDSNLTLRSFSWTLEETLPKGHGRLRAEAKVSGSLASWLSGIHALATRTPHTDAVNIDLRLNRREQQLTGRGLIGTILIDVMTDIGE